MPVIKVNSLDLSKITFSDVKTDNHGRKMVFVNYDGGKIMVQTPKMYVPNGIKRWRKKDATDNKDDSFEMEMSFGGEDKNVDIREFHNKMKEFDELVKKQIISHSKEWLGKPKVSMELVENAFYSPTVRVPMDKEGNILDYPSRIRAKLDRERDYTNDSFTGRFLSCKKPPTPVLIFDESKQLIQMDENNFESVVPKGSHVVTVLELVYLTITTKVSAKWKLVQAKVARNQQTITGYAMIDDENDEEEVQEDLDSETPVDSNAQRDDDEEEEKESQVEDVQEDVQEEEDDLEPEPEPVVTKPKPRARRAVA